MDMENYYLFFFLGLFGLLDLHKMLRSRNPRNHFTSMSFYNNMAKWNIPDRDAAALLSLSLPPLERCGGNVQHTVMSLLRCWEKESRAELLPLQWVCCSGLKHDIPPSASPQVYQHTSQRIYTQYTRFLRDRRVTFRDVVKCIRFISNKRRSLANFTLICHVAVHLYKRPQHALAQHTGQRRRTTWIFISSGFIKPI